MSTHTEEIHAPQLRFLGEQDGPPERELKSRLVAIFEHEQNVKSAYLVRVTYGDQSPVVVALCLRVQSGSDDEVAENAGRIFASMFGKHEHLDIIFLSDAQEAEVVKVCRPFFRA